MSLRINNNISSVNGIKNLQKNSMMLGKSMEKLSSGLRINRAADDAAGLVISEQMRAQITGLSAAISNSETAVNLVQTAEGAMDEMNSLLNKARSLALNAANEGTIDTPQKVANQAELDEIIGSITRIAQTTQFGTKKLMDGSLNREVINDQSVVTAFTSTGLANGNYDVNIDNAGVKAGQAANGAIFTDSEAATIFGVVDHESITSATGLEEDTTFSVEGRDGTAVSVTITAGTSLGAAVSQFNAAAEKAGYSIAFTEDGGADNDDILVLSATDTGEYANGSVLKLATDSGTTATVGDNLSGGKNVTLESTTVAGTFAATAGAITADTGIDAVIDSGADLDTATLTNDSVFTIENASGEVITRVDIDEVKPCKVD